MKRYLFGRWEERRISGIRNHEYSISFAEMLRRNEYPANIQNIIIQKQNCSANDQSFLCQFIQMPLSGQFHMKRY